MKSFYKFFLLIFILFISISSFAKQYNFYSGPPGGIYQYYINGIASIAKKQGYTVKVYASNGAVENIRKVNEGKADFAITYSGILNSNKYNVNNVRTLGCLYGSPGQLIVKSNSNIYSIYDLKGKRVGVGSIGSGAESSIEDVLKYLNLWNNIIVNFIGYNKAAEEFIKGNIDAFWVLSGVPNSAIVKTSKKVNIRLIDFYNVLNKSGFFKNKILFKNYNTFIYI